jgi:two-component system KDP operon response regulator KdpE
MTTVVEPARILLVEDNELNRSLVNAIVARTRHPALRGARLVEAPNLAQARAALPAEPFDVVLLDVHLPDGSGLALAQELTAQPGPRPAIVALTAAALPREQAAAMEAGCDAFLAKPYTSGELVEAIARLLPEKNN